MITQTSTIFSRSKFVASPLGLFTTNCNFKWISLNIWSLRTLNGYIIHVSLCILESKIFAKDVSTYQVSSLEWLRLICIMICCFVPCVFFKVILLKSCCELFLFEEQWKVRTIVLVISKILQILGLQPRISKVFLHH